MPLPQFWTVCFFLMLILLAVDTHVITTVTQLVDNIFIQIYIWFDLILSAVHSRGEFHHHGLRLLSEAIARPHQAWDLCPGRLFVQLPASDHVGYWGKQIYSVKANLLVNTSQGNCSDISVLFLVQGGIYMFHLIDYYGATRFCYYFMAPCECLVVSWIFGVWDYLFPLLLYRPCMIIQTL